MPARAFAVVIAALLLVAIPTGAAQSVGAVELAPSEDVSLPFWCDWGYDWDERCYRADGDRIPIGGDADKVWRAALRFPIASLPPDAEIVSASLHLLHDGRCLGPRKTLRVCEERGYEIDAHPILTTDWFDERELEFGPAVAGTELDSAEQVQWLALDLTDLVAEWADETQPNNGVLLKLSDSQENYGISGPAPPSSSFSDSTRRPRLEVTYVRPSG